MNLPILPKPTNPIQTQTFPESSMLHPISVNTMPMMAVPMMTLSPNSISVSPMLSNSAGPTPLMMPQSVSLPLHQQFQNLNLNPRIQSTQNSISNLVANPATNPISSVIPISPKLMGSESTATEYIRGILMDIDLENGQLHLLMGDVHKLDNIRVYSLNLGFQVERCSFRSSRGWRIGLEDDLPLYAFVQCKVRTASNEVIEINNVTVHGHIAAKGHFSEIKGRHAMRINSGFKLYVTQRNGYEDNGHLSDIISSVIVKTEGSVRSCKGKARRYWVKEPRIKNTRRFSCGARVSFCLRLSANTSGNRNYQSNKRRVFVDAWNVDDLLLY